MRQKKKMAKIWVKFWSRSFSVSFVRKSALRTRRRSLSWPPSGCGSVHAAAGCSGASGVLKPLNNSQKGSRMIWNAATGRTRTSHPEALGVRSTRSNQPTMLAKNIKA